MLIRHHIASRDLLRTVLRARIGAFLLAATVALPTAVWAEEGALPDRLTVKVGGFAARSIDTTIRLDRQKGILGTSIDTSRDLDLDDTDLTPRVDGYFRFNDRHRIEYTWFKIERDGENVIGRQIDFGNVTFPIGTNISSDFKTETLAVSYTWSFHRTDKVELGIGGGLHITEYESVLVGAGIGQEDGDTTAPLPVVGFRLKYKVTPKLSWAFEYDAFHIEKQDEFEGSMTDTRFVVEHHTFKHVGFGGGLNRFNFDIESEDDDFIGTFKQDFNGWLFYTTAYF